MVAHDKLMWVIEFVEEYLFLSQCHHVKFRSYIKIALAALAPYIAVQQL